MSVTVSTVEIPKFVPCSHGEFFDCNCLDADLKERYIYRHHKHDNFSCLKKAEKLGHLEFTQSGYYLIEKPVWRHECTCNYNFETQEKISKLIDLFQLKCECTSTYCCALCNGFWTNDAKNFNRVIYIHRNLQLDLNTCLLLFPFIQFSTLREE